MYNQEIYDKLEEKFGAFNMPIICNGIAELYNLLNKEQVNTTSIVNKEAEYEAVWWTSAIEKANISINENDW